MLELQGKYASAKVFTDVVDSESISQIINLCNQPFAEFGNIRMMPDVHAGAGCTIGTTMRIHDKVVPNLVGVDIGCGMKVVELTDTSIDFERLDRVIHDLIPSGMKVREEKYSGVALKMLLNATERELSELCCKDAVDLDRAMLSFGTLGGGNHFIEVDKDEEGRHYLVVHSGSRHLGLEVAKYYQKLAWEQLKKQDVSELIAQMKAEGRQREIQAVLEEARDTQRIPKELAYLEGHGFDAYIHDIAIIQKFAACNRTIMAHIICKNAGLHPESEFTTIHNYIDTTSMILRKGAVSAVEGEKLLIPINMRDGSLICRGKGNPDWNWSAPHGAGRLMSRSQAKAQLSMDEFRAEMSGVYTTSVSRATLDESPMAYKSMADIVENIEDTVDILKVIKPVYNFKAGE